MTPGKTKVLFLIDYFHRTGGTEKHLVQLVCWLARENFHCEVVVFDLGANEMIAQMRAAGVLVHDIRVEREYGTSAMRGALALARLIRARRFDVVQTYHQKSDTFGALVARLAGVRHILSSKRDTGVYRKPYHFFLNRRLKWLFERTIVVADAVADAVVASDHLDRARLVKIYNGVDSDRFAPADEAARAAARKRFGIGADDLVVGMVAGFRPEKHQHVLLEAAAEVSRAVPRLKVLLVGDGPELPAIRARFGAQPFAVFAGDVPDVWNALRAVDIGCLLSAKEGFSNAVVEKMACGLPMIVSDAGGNSEAVVHRDNGYVIPPGDTRACADALRELATGHDLRLAMGRRSRQLVLDNFSLRQMCERHAKLYRELCGVAAPLGLQPAAASIPDPKENHAA